MRPFPVLVVVFAGFGCAQETFDLLPPPRDELAGGMASGGRGPGEGGMIARGGRIGLGGRPSTDCPASMMGECRSCSTSMDCRFGEICDRLRFYCAVPCQTNDECPFERVFCDEFRHTCVQCIEDTHCFRGWECDRGECVPPPPQPCMNSMNCSDFAPVCDHNACRGCYDDGECQFGEVCRMGRCDPPPPGP